MRRVVRTIVFNTDPECAVPLREHLLSIERVKIAAEIDEPGMLGPMVDRIRADLLIAHLDPEPERLLPLAAAIATQHPDLAVFAISAQADGELILVALRSGMREFLVKPVDPDQLAAAIAKVREQKPTTQRTGQLISVFGSVGGAGATTLAANLATELKQLTSGKVAVVDLDFRYGQLATCFDLQPHYTVADLCDTPEGVDQQMIEKAMFEHDCGVHVLARPNSVGQAEQITAAHCVSVLSTLQEMYEYVVMDGPTRYDASARSVLDLADLSFLVVQLLVPSVRSAHRILADLETKGCRTEDIKLVCNRDARSTGRLTPEHVAATLDRDFYALIPNDWEAVSSAVNVGEPLATASPKSRARLGIKGIAERIAEADHPGVVEEKGPARAGGMLSKLFS